jgi:hypothetical protein
MISSSTMLGPVDVYLLDEGALEITTEEPFFEDLEFSEDTGYIVTAVGNYQVVLTSANSIEIFSRIIVFDPPSESIITLFAIERHGEGGPYQIIEVTRDWYFSNEPLQREALRRPRRSAEV